MQTKRTGKHYKLVSDIINLDKKKNNVIKKEVDDYDIDELIELHQEPETWLNHLNNDLLPYWLKQEATEFVYNLFPTYRTNKGDLLPNNKEDWPKEFIEAIKDNETKGLIDPDYNYVRAHSRQTYAYGIAYNMTGVEQYLQLCKKGVDALVNAIDGMQGMLTKQNNKTGNWDKDIEYRTSQDLAYGISGMAMYYYLTHDEKILIKIIKTKKYLFDNYYDEGKGIFTWFSKYTNNNQVEIVAQLDQIYGYMMFLTPSLPEPYKTEWKQELKMIANILIERFYSPRFGFFWGSDTDNKAKDYGTDHTDFGHSVKTMWLIYQIGILTHETSFVIFAREKIDVILKNAFVKETGSWARRFIRNPNTNLRELDEDKEWWGLAELDQACAILSLNDPSYLSYLNKTYDYWFKYMVDKEDKEVWHYVSAKDNKPLIKYPKIHSWKNAFHSFEHALFGYITSSEIKNKEFSLYYAFITKDKIDNRRVVPYLFKANIINKKEIENINFLNNERKKIKITFNMLH